jgi:hypothetical protein
MHQGNLWLRFADKPLIRLTLKKTLKSAGVSAFGEANYRSLANAHCALRTHLFRFHRKLLRGACKEIAEHENPNRCIRFGDAENEYFFGYYDLCPLSSDRAFLLGLQLPSGSFNISPPFPVRVGYFWSGEPERFQPVGETDTWCWQQGCRLQWYPIHSYGKNKLIVYNTAIDRQYGSCIRHIESRKVLARYTRPMYALTPSGRYGFSLNFSRLGRLRPGYGYPGIADATASERIPKNDGVWRVDIQNGRADLLFSVSDIVRLSPLETMEGATHYFNHISVNPTGSRFLFFHVWIRENRRFTRLITCDTDGSKPFPLINEGHVSHYTWKSDDELLCFSTHSNCGTHYYLYRDQSNDKTVVGRGKLDRDGHPTFSPDRRFLLTDTYPDRYGERSLLLYDLSTDSLRVLGKFYHSLAYSGERRCDLHPRWSPSGANIVFDSVHENRRAIYMLKVHR